MFEEVFICVGVLYKVIGDILFYGCKEIKDMIVYLCVVFNSADTVSLNRIINTLTRGIGNLIIEKFSVWIDMFLKIDGVLLLIGDVLFNGVWRIKGDEG